jgi:hypothetical protein
VRRGPGVPLNVNFPTGLHLCHLRSSSGVFVASDPRFKISVGLAFIWLLAWHSLGDIGVQRRINKAIIEALRAGPLNDLRRRGLVLERRIVCSERLTVNGDLGEMAVSRDGRGEGSDERCNLNLGRHFGVGVWRLDGEDGTKVRFEVNEGMNEGRLLQSMKGSECKKEGQGRKD